MAPNPESILAKRRGGEGDVLFGGGFVTSRSHDKILKLVMSYGRPVEHEELQWVVDVENIDEYQDLGPRPRRERLLTIVNDLVDRGLLANTVQGIDPRPVHVEVG